MKIELKIKINAHLIVCSFFYNCKIRKIITDDDKSILLVDVS